MRGGSIWAVLGVAPTDSEAEVRAAYARKLKLTNPEDDAEGFKQLRAAYEAAMSQIRWRTAPRPALLPEVEDDEPFEEFDDEEPIDEQEAAYWRPPIRPPRPRDSSGAAIDEDAQAHRLACDRLHSVLVARETEAAILAAYEAVRTSPAMQTLDIYSQTEAWLIWLLHNLRPASDVLVARAIEDFGWEKAARRLRDGTGAAGMLALRKRIQEERETGALAARLADPRHEFHWAYREMKRPFAERNWLSRQIFLLRVGLVERLLDYIAAKNLRAEDMFDKDAVAWWRQRLSKTKSPLWLWHIVARSALAIGLFWAFVVFIPHDEAQAPAEVVVQSVDASVAVEARVRCDRAVRGLNAQSGACDQILALAPDSLLMRQYAGILALRGRDFEAARLHFEAIRAVAPTDAYAIYGQGLALIRNESADERARGFRLVAGVLRSTPTVRSYFRTFTVYLPTEDVLRLDEPAESFPERPAPAYDTPPHTLLPPAPSAFEEAVAHFGMSSAPPAGRVTLECLSRLDQSLSDCLVVDESPNNSGLAELALRLARLMRAQPAMRDGVPVDRVPVRMPLEF